MLQGKPDTSLTSTRIFDAGIRATDRLKVDLGAHESAEWADGKRLEVVMYRSRCARAHSRVGPLA
jgi:hypothetical protein